MFYEAIENKLNIKGLECIYTENGKYINYLKAIKYIQAGADKITSIILTNIVELFKSAYEEFFKASL